MKILVQVNADLPVSLPAMGGPRIIIVHPLVNSEQKWS